MEMRMDQCSGYGYPFQGIKTIKIVTANPTAPTAAPAIAAAPPVQKEFVWPPTAEQDAYFTQYLYISYNKKRLPIFKEICLD